MTTTPNWWARCGSNYRWWIALPIVLLLALALFTLGPLMIISNIVIESLTKVCDKLRGWVEETKLPKLKG